MGKFSIFGGGGKVARHFARSASAEGHQVVSVVRNDTHSADLKSLGATPAVLSLEDAGVPDITNSSAQHQPDAVIFAAGAGGKGDKSRTRKVDYEGAVKVFDALESANTKRLVLVSSTDTRKRDGPYPAHYNEESKKQSDKVWETIPEYMQAKYDADVESHRRKAIQFTVVRPGWSTEEPAKGAQAGITQIEKTSRELVAKASLFLAQEPKAAGSTIDLMDGDNDLASELHRVVEEQTDAWTG